MDINQLRDVVNSMTPAQLQDFSSEAALHYGVNQLLGKRVHEHLLSAANYLVDERLVYLGLKPVERKEPRPSHTVNVVSRARRTTGRDGKVIIIKGRS